ncbi:MAG: hypothetical protein CES88_08425 [Halobacteriovorax sp. JY17]|nr:MAG: hypothetical protein CES88_08425 [Halobacteriovorax sp. JY17]
MEGLNFNIFIIISSGLSIFLIVWAFFIKTQKKDFQTDSAKQFVTSSVLNLRTTLQISLSILSIFILTLIIRGWELGELFTRENLLLIVPFILSLVVVLLMEPLSRKS